jgi:hypothetical protein
MKFKDIFEGRRTEPFSEKQLDLINRGLKWNSPTEFYVNDFEGYEESKTYGVYKYLSFKWAKIPKSNEDLITYGRNYKNAKEFRIFDKQSAELVLRNPEVREKLDDFWSGKHYDNRTEEFIKSSEKKHRMDDPNFPNDVSKLIPRFDYTRLRMVGLDASNPKSQKIPPNTLYCKEHNIYFPDEPKSINNHLYSDNGDCPICTTQNKSLLAKMASNTYSKDEWIEKFKLNPANRYPSDSDKKDELKYDYTRSWFDSVEDVKGSGYRTFTRVHDIRCKIHDELFATGDGIRATTHARGQSNCPKCSGSESIGEDRLNGVLINIFGGQDNVYKQLTVPGLTFRGGALKYDRWVKKDGKIICFEFDGGQHFKRASNFQKTDTDFYIQVARDIIKNNYCKRNDIKLIRIGGDRDANNLENEVKLALENSSQMVLSTNYPKLGWNTPDMEKNNPELYRYLKQFKVIGESELKLMNLI